MKKMKAFALLIAILLLLSACKTSNGGNATTPAATTVPAAYGKNELSAFRYEVKEATPTDANMTAVIAIDALGNPVLTNSVLQIYYLVEFYNFMNSYGAYASYFGLDYNKPLADQASMEKDLSWEQSFVKYALDRFSQDYALSQEAYTHGYVLSEEDEKLLADITDPNGDFAKEYTADGFTDADDYLSKTFGDGVDVETYQTYLRQTYAAYDYAAQMQKAITEDEVSTYYDENAETYQTDGYVKRNNATVRHILIQPEGEKDETTGEWTQQQWETAESIANDIYADWQEDPTEESFIALAKEHSDDTASVENGGMYENFGPADMVKEFSAWSFDEARKEGDTSIVKTEYGYHIMYYIGQGEGRAWYDKAASDLLTEKIDALCETYKVSYDYSQVKIFDLLSASVEAQNNPEPTVAPEATTVPEATTAQEETAAPETTAAP